MSGAARSIAPRHVRLSGEIADQAILDELRAVYPQARVVHAYASTEAGLGFEVTDGLEGFPADFVRDGAGEVDIRIVDGSLRLRSRRTASGYVGRAAAALRDGDGLRRYRRHGGAAGRALPLRRAQGRHHQCRRPQGPPRGSRGGDQPPSRRLGVRWSSRAATRSPARSSWPMSCSRRGRRQADAAANDIEREIIAVCRRAPRRLTRCRRRSALLPALELTAPASSPAMAFADAQRRCHRRQPRPRPRHCRQARGRRLSRRSRWRARRVGNCRRAGSGRRAADAIRFAPFDLDDVDGIPRFVARLRKSFGPIYGLVNNAAVGTDGALSLMHNAKIGELVRLNTLSPIMLTKYAVRAMMADGGGRIVNVASIVGLHRI